MPNGIWGALGAALQQGVGTYQNISEQERQAAQLAAAQKFQQEQFAAQQRQNQFQNTRALEQDAMDKKRFDLGLEDRERKILLDAIEGMAPDQDVDTNIMARIREKAPELMSRLNVTPGTAELRGGNINAQQGFGAASAGNPLGLSSTEAQDVTVDTTPEKAVRRASLAEQAAQESLTNTRAKTERENADRKMAERLMTDLQNGKVKDTPANRALLERYNVGNPNTMWGSVEHHSRDDAATAAANRTQLVETSQGLMHYNPRTQQFSPAFGPDGQPITKQRPAKPPTGVERRVLNFYNRAKESVDNVMSDGLETRIAQQSVGGQMQGKYAPNMLQTKDQQRYRQGQRAFTEARLRKDSGAAVPEHEYVKDSQIYWAEPGDSDELIAQKQQMRQVVIDSLAAESGNAYADFYGEQYVSPAKRAKQETQQTAPGAKPATAAPSSRRFSVQEVK
jgi:hypothetical protein